jgi:hypothetical protein
MTVVRMLVEAGADVNAATVNGQTPPVAADENLVHLPAMLDEAAVWLMELGKTAVQMAVPDEREQLAAQLESAGWVKSHSWLRLVKWLDQCKEGAEKHHRHLPRWINPPLLLRRTDQEDVST